MLKVWNMVLVILSFVLSIFGTFLTRSGILSSVHTFADSAMGPFFLVFIGITLFGSLGLLYYRSNELKSDAEMESFVSRESTFLLNNLLLVGAAFAVFLGVIFPLISEAVRGVKITVGAPFFDQVNAPIFLAIILLAGVCALIGWRRASLKNLMHNFLLPAVAAVALGIGLVIGGMRQWYALFALVVCAFVILTILYGWLRGTRARRRMRGENYARAFFGLIGANRPRYGGYIVHIGVVLIAIGVIGHNVYAAETEATLTKGESMTINRYALTYDDLDQFDTQSRTVVTATLSVYNGDKLLGKLTPQKYFHRSYEQSVTEVAIRSTLFEDLYVILVGTEDNGTASFKVLVNPMINWIWLGGVVMVLGGVLAFWPERRRTFATEAARARPERQKVAASRNGGVRRTQ